MKAVLLAAGKGERLGDIARTIPKPMLPVLGRPVIEHNIEMCKRFGVSDICINLHHLPEVILARLGDGKRLGVSITYSLEREILGTAGGVKRLADELGGGRFFVIYADNYCHDYDLGDIHERHIQASADMSIALCQTDDTAHGGVAVMNREGWIERFVEKPAPGDIDSRWVNAGIYVIEPKLLDAIPKGFSDFGRDIIPRLIAEGYKILGVPMPRPATGIDTPELLEKARRMGEAETP